MPSPFPGMDPYVESSGRWGDFHGSMIAALRTALNECLPEGFAAEINLYVWFHEPGARERHAPVEPDVYVTQSTREGRRTKQSGGAVVRAPRRLIFPSVARKRQKYLQVLDLQSNRVVTVVELLSPSNKKSGDDREAYLTKRNESLAAGVNLVEIDLLRGGRRLPLGEHAPGEEGYYVLVCRAWEYPEVDFWPFTVRDPLPTVPIPLTAEVGDVLLPLRPSMDQAYDGGRYRERLPYGEPLSPRLSRPEAAWVRELLAAR